ncbi:T9SS type A sorting domain-containing protein [Chryseobacterium sp. NEB161]|nr:T9SS type A sorting domain-containing protein [Chryseobacterium sp. NEB161]
MEKKYFIIFCMVSAIAVSAQTIDFKGCTPLFEDQLFVFNKASSDANGKGIYITSPVDGDQPCGGLGTCEFKIEFNSAENRWEFIADSGNGDFVNPYLIFYNSGGNVTATNPPAANVGTWVENTAVTAGACGGNLTTANSTMTGDVHTSTLAVLDNHANKIQFFPNPVKDILTVSGIKAESYRIYNIAGQLVKSGGFTEKTDLSDMRAGTYIYQVISTSGTVNEFKFIKN